RTFSIPQIHPATRRRSKHLPHSLTELARPVLDQLTISILRSRLLLRCRASTRPRVARTGQVRWWQSGPRSSPHPVRVIPRAPHRRRGQSPPYLATASTAYPVVRDLSG